MSLAATLSASGMRPASFLPAIKCSNCGEEIEIARMGEHICSGGGTAQHQIRQAPTPQSNPYSPPQWTHPPQHQAPPSPTSSSAPSWPAKLPATTFASSPLQHAYSPSDAGNHAPAVVSATTASLRSVKKAMPPRINADTANKPFLAPSYPRSASPASPGLSVRSGRTGSSNGSRPQMFRTMTLPSILRDRSPSPEMASNLDCAFPSFPTSSSSRPGTSNGRKTPTGSERAPSRSGSRPEKDDFRSPTSMSAESVMKRPDIPKGGAFNARRDREENGAMPPLPPSFEIAPPGRLPERVASPEKAGRPPYRKSSLPKDIPALKSSLSEETLEDFPSHLPAPLRLADRSKTFPLHPGNSHDEPLSPTFSRTPSEPTIRSRERRPSIAASVRSEYSQTTPTDSIVRPQSRNGPRTDPRLQDAPPVPRPVQVHRQPSKHAPSESASSASSNSQSYSNTNGSEGPSPISSAASSIDAFSPISQASTHEKDERPKSIGRPAGYSTRSQQQNPGLRAEQPTKRSPPPNFARPRPRGASSTAHGQLQSMTELVESPMEAISDASWANNMPDRRAESRSPPVEAWPPLQSSSADNYDPYKPPSPMPGARSRSKSTTSQYSFYEPDPISSMPPPPIPTETQRPMQRRKSTAKPICRGCDLAIEGKSVKAADGRLTGRWHKHCFTCRTCSQPFATADFYVINDQPYCKQHYHEENGSVCSGCQRGIEGQYLEASSHGAKAGSNRKFHPTCFTCCECRLILSNDYFEIGGKAFCERHALAATRGRSGGPNGRPGPGGLYQSVRREVIAERRTTKLMMM